MAAAAQPLLAVLSGTALHFGTPCLITDRDGSCGHEQFASAAFDGVDVGTVALKVNHCGAALDGEYSSLRADAGALRFRFLLRDGVRERFVLDRIRKSEIRHVSVSFSPQSGRPVGRAWEHERVRLTEISLCADGHRPAWYGTSISIESW
jgi:hypothetical protein